MLLGGAPAADVGEALPEAVGDATTTRFVGGGDGRRLLGIVLGEGEGFDLGEGTLAVAPAVPAVAGRGKVGEEDEALAGDVELAADGEVFGAGEVGFVEFGREGDGVELGGEVVRIEEALLGRGLVAGFGFGGGFFPGVFLVLQGPYALPFGELAEAFVGVEAERVVGEGVAAEELLGDQRKVDGEAGAGPYAGDGGDAGIARPGDGDVFEAVRFGLGEGAARSRVGGAR